MSAPRDAVIDAQIRDAALRFAKDPEEFFFYAVGLTLGIKATEVAERLQQSFLVKQ